ncbi:MAG: endo-1,4-beta-xylanase [Polyangiaceae bacterium]|nr:endo-1,4-beta-xylanase [Polyangiaceae bacterium]
MTTSSNTALPTLARFSPIAALCLWALPAHAQNLVTNGTFDEDGAPWWDHAAEGASQTVEVADGQLCSTIAEGGENTWDVILGLSDLALVAGQYYHVTFSASADAERSIRFKTGLGDTPYTDYFIKTILLTATPQVFDYTYLNLRDDEAAQFQFHIGGSPGTVCVDDIVLEPVEAPAAPAYTTPSLTGHALKDHAALVKMGTSVDTPTFLSSPVHNAIVTGEFSMITPANSMKMNIIQPTQGTFDWVDTDALLAFAEQNSLEFHGHPLVWHTQVPSWLQDAELGREEMIQVMYDHIDALVGRYAGRIPCWDVVNEAIDKVDDVWTFRSTIWHDRIGDDFIDLAFQRAAAADPSAKLIYNDYNIEQKGNGHADRVFELVNDLVTRGIPIHQVGFQSHYYATADGGTSGVPDMSKIRDNMARYAEIGIEVVITECDFRIGKPLSEEKEQMQTKFFADLLQVCIDAPNCSRYTLWGVSDFDSWVPSTFPDYDYAHIFDSDFVAKPAYHALTQVFAAYNVDGTPIAGGTGGGSGTGGDSGTGGGAAAGGDVATGGDVGTGGDTTTGVGGSATGGDTTTGVGGSSAPNPTGGAAPQQKKSSSDSGCAIHPAPVGGNAAWQVGLFALLGLALRARGASRGRARC